MRNGRENGLERDHRTGRSHKIYALIKTKNRARPKKVEEAFRSFAPLAWVEGRDDIGLGVELVLVGLMPFEPFEPLSPEPLSLEPLPVLPLLPPPPPPVDVLVGFGVVKVVVGVVAMVSVLVESRAQPLELSPVQVYPAAVMRKGRPWE